MLSLLYCLGLYNGGTELRNVCVRVRERERQSLCVSVLFSSCVSACAGGDAVCERLAICEHVYAPLSLNLYMFE